MHVQMVRILVGTGDPLMVLKTETLTEFRADPGKIIMAEPFFVCRGYAYLDADKLIFAPGITFLQLQKLLVNSSGRLILHQIGHDQVTFLRLPKGVLDGPASVGNSFCFGDHR
jgi:hypothetical protein